MTPALLPIEHIQQRSDGDCIAACAAMILKYMGIAVGYERLLALLRTSPIGAASFRVRELEHLGITVVYKQGDLAELHRHLLSDRPCIAFVKSSELPYSNLSINHAVVVSGIDDELIYLNDPDLDYAPVAVSHGDFGLAWLERDEYYAAFLHRD
ncbi:MAG: hypothetical protein FJ030_03900 [Chloroflexi bacterium]|nr:hypothetical protein [Chloroflexota bacterium]